MLLSINWLRDYLLKADVRIDPKDLADRLTMRGLSVASVKRPSLGLENVIVGKIIKIEKHPNADRLSVTQVIVTERETDSLQIVCGASNIAEGDIVPVALVGAVLPGNFMIKNSTIRGVESKGMICSGRELGLSEDSEGILQLPKHSAVGRPVSSLLGQQDDTILEFELTPNRGDCLGVIGLAREIAPLLKTKLREPKPGRFRISPHRTSSIIKVEIEDPAICPRYVARVIDGLRVTESPDWIKQRLQSVGIRAINNIVDITNFVMLEYGQPLHAFDLRKIESGTVRVSSCKAPMDFVLLNNERVQLAEGDILIQDGERPIALAGIMGGANSQIESDTTSLVLESAAFWPEQIRRTAKRLGLSSDASKRFEKGVDPVGVALASERAAALLRDSVNANVYHPPIDTDELAGKEGTLSVDMRDVRKITGMQFTSETVADLLETIGITSHKKSVNILSVRLPTYRLDLKESVDIIEEVARLAGYDAIPEHYPVPASAYDRFDESQFEFECRTKNILSHLGLREVINYSFTSEETLRKYGQMSDQCVILKNPLSEEMRVLRTSLLPSLLNTYLYNKNRKVSDQRIFELSKAYFKDEQEETSVREITYVSGILAGQQMGLHWKGQGPAVDFYYVKGLVEILARQLTTVFLAYEPIKSHPLFHPNRAAAIRLGLKEVGFVGEIHPFVRNHHLETEEPLTLFELNLDALRKYERSSVRYKTPSKYPSVELDLAFVLDQATPSNSMIECIRNTGGSLLNDITIFDVYEGEHVPNGKKSLAFRLTFFSGERTLLDDEVNGLKDKIIQAVGQRHNAQLRA
jgi:phenylalanyl-tRNA synthetase beta chain